MLTYFGEDDTDTPQQEDDLATDEDIIIDDLSHLKSLEVTCKSRPFRVTGSIGTATLQILIDTSSTHDFLHSRIAALLWLPLMLIKPFRLCVENGASITYSHIAKSIKLMLQDIPFTMDFHILDVHGSDVILGMAWLESLGTVSAYFVHKTLAFTRHDISYIICGLHQPPRLISLQSFLLVSEQPIQHDLYELISLEGADPSSSAAGPEEMVFPVDLPLCITAVLEACKDVFALPIGMPPKWEFDHRIHLLPNTKPINVRPYRYPYFQKMEIERQVREMLDQGIIQCSQSSFSSPVLLIRKKDGMFRFCIDYRALNMATVPDHFPIPTADELFDELGGA